MSPMLVQIGIAIATILGSGVVSACVSHKFTVDRAEREFRRRRLEELYLAVLGYCKLLYTTNVIWPRVMEGDLDYNQALDIILEQSNKPNRERHDETVDMIISLYFPQLNDLWKELLSARDKINGIQAQFKALYLIHGPGGGYAAYINPFHAAVDAAEQIEHRFKSELSKMARAI